MSQLSPSKSEPSVTAFDYRGSANTILKLLRRDRDRQIIGRRFGFGLAKRQTLEQIGRDFGVTRERVRQIEKAAIAKIKSQGLPEVKRSGELLASYLEPEGGIARLEQIAAKLGATTPAERSYIAFLAALAPQVEVIDDDENFRSALGRLPDFDRATVERLATELNGAIVALGHPATLSRIGAKMATKLPATTLAGLASIRKNLANFETKWGLSSWPEVNPKSIRDKTYLVLNKQGRPLHFGDIARHIQNLATNQRQVTVQAVHNELIKDQRFILIGRGIYALAEWGYTPGTVADIIVDVLRGEQPLHKDEIVRRVLMKRQVKTTTIILNLQEKDQFQRVAKATYQLKES